MEKKQLVFVRLKPKAKALGFNTKELKGIAAKIADNLALEEDASEEDVNTAIDDVIDAALPYLGFGQSQANRMLDEWKKKHPTANEEEEEEEEEEESSNTSKRGKSGKPQNKGNDDTPEWAKSMMQPIQNLTGEINTLKGEKTTNARKAKLEALLKDTGTFGKRTLRSFDKMNFESEEEFEDFLDEVTEDLKAYNQERADQGLQTMGNRPSAGGKENKKIEPFTDEELEAMAD